MIRRNAALDNLQPLYVLDTNKKNQPTSSYTTVANLSYASAVANMSLKFLKSVALSKTNYKLT
jgi:hypothetical protein